MGSRAGRRIRVNVYRAEGSDEVIIGADLLDKQMSNCNGKKVWIAIYRGKAQRPSQAIKCFNFWAMSNAYIDYKDPASYSLEYWVKDMNLRKLSSQT
jgi:hypothetical protein